MSRSVKRQLSPNSRNATAQESKKTNLSQENGVIDDLPEKVD